MITVGDVTTGLFRWAPRALADEHDNVGLIVGREDAVVRGILVCLDVTEGVVREAVAAGANLIVSHHPVIYRPVQSIREDDAHGRLLAMLLKHDISAVAMHTNADAAAGGVNDALARTLDLVGISSLDPPGDAFRQLQFEIDPTAGGAGALEESLASRFSCRVHWTSDRRDRGQVDLPQWEMDRVHRVLREDFAEVVRSCMVVSMRDAYTPHGIGAIGMLRSPLPAREFLAMVKDRLGCPVLRTSAYADGAVIRRVAVCGGAGAFLAERAIAHGADALVTADVTYHAFMDVRARLLLVDAGHFETERVFIPRCQEILRSVLGEQFEKINILPVACTTNPVEFH